MKRPHIVNVHEAKTNFSRLLDRAKGGEEIVIAKAGKPWARLVPLETPPMRIPGRHAIQSGAEALEPLSDTELEAWE